MGIRKRRWNTNPKDPASGEWREAWVVDYATNERDQKTGRLKRHIKTFDRKKDAETWAAETRVAVGRGTHTPHSRSITVETAGKLWIDSCGDLERSTRDQYQQHLDYHIVPYLGAVKLSELTVDVVKDWQNKLRKGMPALGQTEAKPRSLAMIKKLTTSLSSLLSEAMESGKVGHNVVRSMTTTRRKKSKLERRHKKKLVVGRDIPEPGEIDLLLQHETSERWRAFFLAAIRCGLRSSELRGLRWIDIDLKKAELHVRVRADRYNQIGTPKSEDSQRTVPIPPKTLAALKAWKPQCPKLEGRQHFVFPNGEGNVETHSNIVERGLIPAWERAGVTVPVLDAVGKPTRDEEGRPIVEAKYSGLHSLRHFFASWCLARPPVGLGLSLKELSERLGHESVNTTEIYTHLIERPDHTKELAAAEGAHG